MKFSLFSLLVHRQLSKTPEIFFKPVEIVYIVLKLTFVGKILFKFFYHLTEKMHYVFLIW